MNSAHGTATLMSVMGHNPPKSGKAVYDRFRGQSSRNHAISGHRARRPRRGVGRPRKFRRFLWLAQVWHAFGAERHPAHRVFAGRVLHHLLEDLPGRCRVGYLDHAHRDLVLARIRRPPALGIGGDAAEGDEHVAGLRQLVSAADEGRVDRIGVAVAIGPDLLDRPGLGDRCGCIRPMRACGVCCTGCPVDPAR